MELNRGHNARKREHPGGKRALLRHKCGHLELKSVYKDQKREQNEYKSAHPEQKSVHLEHKSVHPERKLVHLEHKHANKEQKISMFA